MSEENDEQQEQEEKPILLGTKIRLSGDKDNCGHCKEGDEFFSTKAPEAGAKYEYYHIETPKGKEIAENVGIDDDGNVPLPSIEYCKSVKEGDDVEEKCDYISGFNKKDWDEKLNYRKPNSVDEELDEIFGED